MQEEKTENMTETGSPAEASAEAGSEDKTENVTETEEKQVETQSPTQTQTQTEVKEAPKKASKEVSPKLEDIIKSIETMTVLELADLVKALEERFGVTAAASMAVAAAPTAGAAASEAAEEQTSFTVVLTSAGANKIGAIKAVREIIPTLGLKEAKDLVDAAPKTVLEGANKQAATEAKGKLEAAGAQVELK